MRPSRKLRTSPVQLRWTSPAPNTSVGFTRTTGSRSAARRDRSPAAWKTRSTPRRARRRVRRSSTSQRTRSQSRSSISRVSAPGATPSRSSSPRASSIRAMCEPMNPVAPVTSVRAVSVLSLGRSALPLAALEVPLAVDAANGLGDDAQPLRGNRLAAVPAGAVAAVTERPQPLGDPVLLVLEHHLGGLVDLLVVQLAAGVARVVVDVGELGAAHSITRSADGGTGTGELLQPGPELR